MSEYSLRFDTYTERYEVVERLKILWVIPINNVVFVSHILSEAEDALIKLKIGNKNE